MRNSIVAESLPDLELQLAANPATIPQLVGSRANKERERWQADSLLRVLARGGFVAFPLSSTLRDKPDCRLESAGVQIGLEITELVSPGLRDAQVIAESIGFDRKRLDVSSFTFGGTRADASDREIRDYFARGETDPRMFRGYAPGNAQALFSAANDRVASKTRSLNLAVDGKPNFDIYPKNFLGIYASYAHVDDPSRFQSLVENPANHQGSVKFDQVFLLLADHCLVIWPGGQVLNIQKLLSE